MKKKRRAKLGKSLDRAIARFSRKGLSNRKIGELLGVNYHSIGERRKSMGLAQPVSAKIKDWKEIERLYVDERLSLDPIAKRYGVNPEAIRQGLLRRGVVMRSLSLDNKIKDWNEVAGLYVDQKLDLRAIAKRFGVSAKSIETNLVKRGVVMRSSQQALMDWKSERDRLVAEAKILRALRSKSEIWQRIVPLLLLHRDLSNEEVQNLAGLENRRPDKETMRRIRAFCGVRGTRTKVIA